MKVKRIIIGVLIGVLLLSGGGYAGWCVDKDSEEIYKELTAKRYQNMSLQNYVWNLEDQLFERNKELATKERAYQRAAEKSKDFYMGRIEQLSDSVTALKKQVAGLQKQRVDEVKGKWGGLRDFHGFEEWQRFVMEDRTDKLQYAEEILDCEDYVAIFTRNAALEGFRVYPLRWVFIEGNRISPFVHRMCEVVVIETMPDGKVARWLVWYEPQSDEWLKIGLEDDPSSWRDKIIPFLP